MHMNMRNVTQENNYACGTNFFFFFLLTTPYTLHVYLLPSHFKKGPQAFLNLL
jgi:hypothetical protein